MHDSALIRFFGVVTRPRTWLGILFHVLAFPLGLFYFIFLVTGLSVGVGLIVVWVGIPVLLVVAGAWWLFAAFERLQAQYLLGAGIPPEPRAWETVDGVWGKLKAHFGSGSTWLDLAYLVAKLVFGTVSFTLLVTLASLVLWLLAMPVFAIFDVPLVNASWVPPLWFAILCVPLGILLFFASLHIMNGWGWVCARWAELLFKAPPPAPGAFAPQAAPAAPAGWAAPGATVASGAAAPPSAWPGAPAAPPPATPPAAPAPPAAPTPAQVPGGTTAAAPGSGQAGQAVAGAGQADSGAGQADSEAGQADAEASQPGPVRRDDDPAG